MELQADNLIDAPSDTYGIWKHSKKRYPYGIFNYQGLNYQLDFDNVDIQFLSISILPSWNITKAGQPDHISPE
jgi:hypothetical protein